MYLFVIYFYLIDADLEIIAAEADFDGMLIVDITFPNLSSFILLFKKSPFSWKGGQAVFYYVDT